MLQKAFKKIIVFSLLLMLSCLELEVTKAEATETNKNVLCVDGDMTISEGAKPYIENPDDIKLDQLKVKSFLTTTTITDHSLKANNATGDYSINSTQTAIINNILGVPVFTQENSYYCGPATIKQVLHFLSGYEGNPHSESQDYYASESGTTVGGTDMTRIPDVLNAHQSVNTYIYREFTSRNQWDVRTCGDIGINVPVVIDIDSTSVTFWKYKTAGHFMALSGRYWDDTYGVNDVWVTDPHYAYSGTYRYTADQVYTVNNSHWRHAIVY